MISSLQLAKICGVSQGTVDRALHNRKGVNEKTRQQILAAAAEHGYAPNPVARELMTGTSTTVGMILPKFNRFFLMDLADAIKHRLKAKGFRLVLATADDAAETQEAIDDFASRRVRSLIVIPPTDNFTVSSTRIGNLPLISLLTPCRATNAWFVQPDETRTGIQAADYLAGQGHSSFLHVTYIRKSPAIRERDEGFMKRITELGLKSETIHGFDPDLLLRKIRENGVTALFCHNDWLALCALRVLNQANIAVPGAVRILGVDNSPSFTDIFPDITTLSYPFTWCADEIASIIASGKKSEITCPPFQLVERKT